MRIKRKSLVFLTAAVAGGALGVAIGIMAQDSPTGMVVSQATETSGGIFITLLALFFLFTMFSIRIGRPEYG